jgi:DNA repair exonuclease SbcCD ATPase subunit
VAINTSTHTRELLSNSNNKNEKLEKRVRELETGLHAKDEELIRKAREHQAAINSNDEQLNQAQQNIDILREGVPRLDAQAALMASAAAKTNHDREKEAQWRCREMQGKLSSALESNHRVLKLLEKERQKVSQLREREQDARHEVRRMYKVLRDTTAHSTFEEVVNANEGRYLDFLLEE